MQLNTFLEQLFTKLDSSKVDYSILRNHEKLPWFNVGTDIDILSNKKDMADIISCIHEIDNVKVTGLTYRNFITVVYIYGVENNKSMGLELDFIHEIGFKGLTIFNSEELLKKRTMNERGVSVLPPEYEHVITFLSSYLYSGYIKQKYFPEQAKFFRANEDATLVILSEMFGKDYSENLLTCILIEDKENALKIRGKCIRHLFYKKFNFYSIFNITKHLFYETSLIFNRCNSVRIAFLGPDGSGKSTILDKVISNLHGTSNKIDLCHLKPTLLFKNRIKERGVVTEPHAAKDRGKFMSYLKLIFWVLEYRISKLKRVRNFQLEVFDRYFHDIYIDPKRYLYSGSKTYTKLIEFFIPKPDAFFIIVASPDTIQSRKQEVSHQETERQVNEYKAFSEKHNNCFLIINETDIETAIAEVESNIVETLSNNVVRRS